jgi:hypothetical protein
MTMTCCPLADVSVVTSCCALVFSLPASLAFTRSRWMLANTAERSAVKALPILVVHSICSAIVLTTCGKSTIAT